MKTQSAPGTIRRTATFNWPDAGIKKGHMMIVRLGSVRVGQIVSLLCRRQLCTARLVSRNRAGEIVLCGVSGKSRTFQRDEYDIEGTVIETRPQTPAERWEAKEKARIKADEKRQKREAEIWLISQAVEALGFEAVKEVIRLVKAGRTFDEVIQRVSGHRYTQTQSAAVTDLNLWRQSHPRPIKTCAVRVE